eukprot:CAMPEP_0184292710 /NCGR_PEP_ID=MMETSP1049-20130417/4428_1 /TAXON_ID=77928 /ORGANISM="Proteomonas sulcata, Strain CCMP704" /LENGTH=67 /DNA_ID=CAMNT_0026600583 /DNA_START=316 /DNA_END=516 /DNA_ORIENTATION=+
MVEVLSPLTPATIDPIPGKKIFRMKQSNPQVFDPTLGTSCFLVQVGSLGVGQLAALGLANLKSEGTL